MTRTLLRLIHALLCACEPWEQCGWCDRGQIHDPSCRRRDPHLCEPVSCPYCTETP